MSSTTTTISDDLRKACEVLGQGGLLLYPTDTVWGIGCDATNAEAVERVYRLKQRNDNKSMLVLVDSAVKVDFYVRDVPEVAWDLVELADRPLTIVYPNARNLAPNLVAPDGSIGIRVTREPISRQLCQRFRRAIVSTSANIAGQPTPATFGQISQEIRSGVDYIMQARRNDPPSARPSAIIKIGEGGLVQIIRE